MNKSGTVVFTFGRMQPPTIGHELLINKLVETARNHNADHVVYLSQTQNNKTDPLDWDFKRRVCNTAFRGVYISEDKSIKNPFLALESLSGVYSNVIMVAGSDQSDEFLNRFRPYAKKLSVNFSVVNAGQRINESDGVEGISATKMRNYAMNNSKELFMQSLASNIPTSIKKMVFEKVQSGLSK